MLKLIYSIIVGLVGAALLHVSMIFLLPGLSGNTAWSFVEQNTELFEPTEFADQTFQPSQNLFFDPLFRHFFCRYDLSEGALRLTANGDTPFWSVAAIDSSGSVFFSANDRIANSQGIDIAVVNQLQLRFVRQNTPEAVAQSLLAPASSNDGFLLVRVFMPDSSWKPDTDQFFETMACSVLEF